jgi:uncharacterized membrane protein (TIGR01666 family)
MDYLKEYKSIINSHYLSQGIRITIGVVLPAIVLSYFNNLAIGIIVSLGAMSVSITDNPGPIHHRRNGMIACNLAIFVVALLTGMASGFPFMLGVLIFTCCFIFSMIGVYGSRATSIGLSALLVMVLNIDKPAQGNDVILNALYVFAGGTWYIILSLLLYSLRPYKLTQQALGECVQSTADYLRIKASFYNKEVDYDKSYQRLLEQQADLHQKQDLIRELLFKSRNLVKESTHTSRILVMIFLDIVDLFEMIMTSHQDYRALHHFFYNSNILQQYQQVMLSMANELDEIGIAVKSGKPSAERPSMNAQIKQLKENFHVFRDEHRSAENVEGFISLRHILESIEDIADRMHTLHSYTSYDRKLSKNFKSQVDYEQFITHQDIDPGLLKENLSLKSNIFRHSLRVSIATLLGYCISKFLPFGHSYWVLLTIIVILKPAYSLTKKRNYERLFGTIAGALIGILVLYFFKDKTILLAFLIFFMLCTYSLIRIRYLLSVLFMTPYILLLFHLLNPAGFQTILSDRLIDTGIGSAIAFLANIFILPAWEHEQIFDYINKILEDNTRYFIDIAGAFSGKPVDITQYKLSRKNTFVSLANLSDAFNRMLAEPKRKQKNIRYLHQFVVLNHMLTSHIATLAYYAMPGAKQRRFEDYTSFINAITVKLNNVKGILREQHAVPETPVHKEEFRLLNDKVNRLTEQRRAELKNGITESDTRKRLSELKPVADQFNFIIKIASDLEKLIGNLSMSQEVGKSASQ